MGLDNEMARDQQDFLHHCYRDRSVSVNPIIDWSDADVWQFLNHYGCKSNPLYACGEKRVGCKESGLPTQWQSGEEVMLWWVGDNTDPNQLSFFDDDEIYDIMSEMG